MQALTAIAATAYAIGLWMFAPQSRWEWEVQQAKRNQNRLTATPTEAPENETTPDIQLTNPIEPDTNPTQADINLVEATEATEATEQEPDTVPDTVEPQQPNLETFTTTQLREMAKKQKLNWRPLINGKRTPLKKPELIQLLTA